MFQSTRPVRGATDLFQMACAFYVVSIHAPRAGRDIASRMVYEDYIVSIHAPRVGRDFAYSRLP